jgi:hypothetical protein
MNLSQGKSGQATLRSCVSIAVGFGLFLAICELGTDFGLARPLLAQSSEQTNSATSGWLLAGSKPANYHTGIDKAAIHEGQPIAYLQSAVPNTDGFGTLMQSIDATNYAGKRIRLRASVKSQDVGQWAGMWMRVDKEHTIVAFDNMQNRAIKGTQPWSTYDVVLDVPEDATSISFGVLLAGSGEVWVDHVTFESVGKDTQITTPNPNQKPALSKTPVNLNFNQ